MIHATPALQGPLIRFGHHPHDGKPHVHGPNCNHDHDKPAHAEKPASGADQLVKTRGNTEARADHDDHHDHGHEDIPKPGDRFQNPAKRYLINGLGWFYELAKSFWQDLKAAWSKVDDHAH